MAGPTSISSTSTGHTNHPLERPARSALGGLTVEAHSNHRKSVAIDVFQIDTTRQSMANTLRGSTTAWPGAKAAATKAKVEERKPWYRRIWHATTYSRRQPTYDLVCSPWMSPRALLAVRVVLALWTTVWMVIALSFANYSGWAILSYFTDCSYIGLWALSMLLLYLSVRYSHDPRSTDLASSRKLRMFASIGYALSFTFAFVVSAVYWGFLAPANGVASFDTLKGKNNISVHALNIVVIFLHFLTSSLVVATWWLLFPVITTACLYLAWAFMWHGINGKWVYSFLNPQSKAAVYMYPLVIVAFFVSFAFVRLLHVLRRKVLGESAIHREVTSLLSERPICRCGAKPGHHAAH
ncbi:hypothetical protein H9P43_003465 [Blastocladiella emersonii ATCC 22665]|nr:hypothetical protein H9P43_003465 [Blastocladiella emersonii ATCC 22665]